MTTLARREPDQVAMAAVQRNPVAAALAKLAENPTPENVASMEKLTALGIQYRKMDAEEDFNADFAAMQAEMPAIVCDKKGPWGGDYADKESIMKQIRPTLEKFGFSVRFDHPASENPAQLVTECVLSHRGGHCVRNSLATRAGRPNKMMTEIQVDAGGYYSGERYALAAMLNIRADKADEDARFLGLALTDEQLEELQRHMAAAGADVANVCKQAGVERIEDIRTGVLRLLHNFLNEKQRNRAAKGAGTGSPAPLPQDATPAPQPPIEQAMAPTGPEDEMFAKAQAEAASWADAAMKGQKELLAALKPYGPSVVEDGKAALGLSGPIMQLTQADRRRVLIAVRLSGGKK